MNLNFRFSHVSFEKRGRQDGDWQQSLYVWVDAWAELFSSYIFVDRIDVD